MSESQEYTPETPDDYLPCEWMPREELEPNDWNPNDMNEAERDRLFKSLMDNGWTQPIVIQPDGTIIDGEQRWTVAARDEFRHRDDVTPPDVGADYVPVFAIDIEDGQARVSTVQHNRARGYISMDELKGYVQDLDQHGVLDDVHDRIGVDREESQRLLDEVTAQGVIGEPGEMGVPWEPVERTEMSEDEMEENRSERVRKAAEKAYADDDEVSKEERKRAREIADNSVRVNFVLTDAQEDTANEALGDVRRAESFLNLIQYVQNNGLVEEVYDRAGYDPDDDE